MKAVFAYETPPHSDVKAPFIKFTLANPLETKSKHLKALLDTGYDGDLLIPATLFSELDFPAFIVDSQLAAIGESITGELLKMLSAYCIIAIQGIDDLKIEAIVDTYPNCSEILIGRRLIEGLSVLLTDFKIAIEN